MINGKLLALIPARGGSKGIKHKNVRLVGGKPLIAWSIETALAAKEIDRVVVSTDDVEIARVAQDYGAEVLKRPAYIADDRTPMIDVIEHALMNSTNPAASMSIFYFCARQHQRVFQLISPLHIRRSSRVVQTVD